MANSGACGNRSLQYKFLVLTNKCHCSLLLLGSGNLDHQMHLSSARSADKARCGNGDGPAEATAISDSPSAA